MNWSGADMRCPRCNQYLPDRCTCNGPSIEEQQGRTLPTFDLISLSINAPGGQLQSAEELELKVLGRSSGQYLAAAAAQRRRRPRYDSPAGAHAGRVEVWTEVECICTFGLGGNARQRRRTIRQLKVDFTVRQTNAATGAIITR